MRQRYILPRPKLTICLIILTTVLAFSIVIFNQKSVYAGGAIGTGGSGTGGSGGAQTRYGWGWYNYATSGGISPYGFRDGTTTWAGVSNQCQSVGADRVISFIVLRESGTNASTGVVYKYNSDWDGWNGFRGDAGGNWIPKLTAKALYDSIDVDKSAFTWGTDVAWFCYSSIPKTWSLSASTAVDRSSANVGDTVTWTHTLTKSGNGATPLITSDIGFNNFNNEGGHGIYDVISSTNPARTFYDSHVITAADAGKSLCEQALYTPTGSEGNPPNGAGGGLLVWM